MKMIAIIMSAVLLLAIQVPVSAAPLYKCEIGGALVFQDTPCPPVKAKQKVACADAEGFANYQDSRSGTCNNLPAGTAKSYDVSAKKSKTESKSSGTSVNANKSKTAGKAVIVRAYTKENGTKVPSYTRNLPGEKPRQ